MLKGFGFTGYRSFGPTPQFLYPLEKNQSHCRQKQRWKVQCAAFNSIVGKIH